MKKISYDGKTIANLVMNILVMVTFIFLPWFIISIPFLGSISGTALLYPFKIISLWSDLGSYIEGDVITLLVVLLVYSFSWYSMLLSSLITVVKLFKTGDTERFNQNAKKCMICVIVNVAIFFVIRFILLAVLKEDLGYFTSYVGDMLQFGVGFYVMLVIGIVGLLLPLGMKSLSMDNVQKHLEKVDLKEKVDCLKNIDLLKNKNSESTGDLLPAITLVDTIGKKDLKIFNLPCVIGRERAEVDMYVYGDTISRKHCCIETYEDKVIIQDLNSMYGTYINNEKLEADQYYALFSQDTLRIGRQEYRVQFNDAILESLFTTVEVAEQQSETVSESVETSMVDDSEEEYTAILGDNDEKTEEIGNATKEHMLLEWVNSTDGSNDVCVITKTPFHIGSKKETSDYVIAAKGVSREHFTITEEDGVYYVTDNPKSTNGVKINGFLIEKGVATVLQTGDILTVGEREYRFSHVGTNDH